MIKYLIKFPIFKRLIPSISLRVLKLIKKNKKFYKIGNIDFYFDFLDPIDRKIILNKEYEHDQVSFLEKIMKKYFFSYFLDIGANSGYYSFYFADKFKTLKIKAFEPSIDAFDKFNKTLNKNAFQNIQIFNFGLSDSERKVKNRSIIKNGLVQSNSAVLDERDKFAVKDFQINSALLKVGDEFFNFRDQNLSIKIDVEGHELFTLKGMINTLKQNKCLILVETSKDRFDEVDSFLSEINYKYIFKSDYRPDYIYTNIVSEMN